MDRLETLIRAGDRAAFPAGDAALAASAAGDDIAALTAGTPEALFDPATGALRLASLRANIDAVHAALAPLSTEGYAFTAPSLLCSCCSCLPLVRFTVWTIMDSARRKEGGGESAGLPRGRETAEDGVRVKAAKQRTQRRLRACVRAWVCARACA